MSNITVRGHIKRMKSFYESKNISWYLLKMALDGCRKLIGIGIVTNHDIWTWIESWKVSIL